MRTLLAGWLAVAVAAMLTTACTDTSRLPDAATTGPNPTLPVPSKALVPTVHVAPAKGWPAGVTPRAVAGMRVNAFATGLDHPRWLYVLPNGDVLVAETAAPPRPDDSKGIKAFFMNFFMKKAGAAVPSANRISLLRDADGDGVAETRTVFLEGLNSPFGITLVGENLYVANTDAVVRFPYEPGETRIARPGIKLTDLPAGTRNHHWTKNVFASRDGATLYATVGKNIRLEKLLDPRAGPIAGDASRLQQVMWNLLANAIKFTPRDGRVQILLERRDSHIEISVADTGVGITPEFIPHVFDRFRQAEAATTRRYGGLGLGLAIVKRLVEMHGGTVRAHSAGEGRGATFTVRLPLSVVHRETDTRAHPTAPKDSSFDFESPDLSGGKVLVGDDQTDTRDLIRRVLADCDADVLTASTAAEALILVERERPHVLVSDIGMPDVDGFELLRRVRALGQAGGGRIPAIALTALVRSEDRTRALRAGFQVHVSKPVEPSELVATVASVVGRPGELGGDS